MSFGEVIRFNSCMQVPICLDFLAEFELKIDFLALRFVRFPATMTNLRLICALGLEIPSARLLEKWGDKVVDPAPLHPRPDVPFISAGQGPQGAPNVEVEALEAAAGADGGRGTNDGPEAEKPDEP